MTTPRRPDLSHVIALTLEAFSRGLCVACPGVVTAYDPATRLASVQPQLRKPVTLEDGSTATETPPVVPHVPVVMPSAGGFSATFPIAPGDSVLLVFSDRSIDTWLDKGDVVDPGAAHMHDLADAIAFPGLLPIPRVTTAHPTDRARFGKDGGPGVEVTGTDVILDGGGASVGRVGDQVQVTIPINTVIVAAPGGVQNSTPITLTGTITAGAPHVKA
jgi:hypothetical protein